MATSSSRIPAFNAADPELWFQIVEACFVRLDITDGTQKYFEVLAVIPPNYAKEVREIIMAPASDQSYTQLKTALIKRLSTSQEEKTRQLLENETMGDEKPSQFLRRLQSLAGTVIPDAVVRSLWVRRLPKSMQPIIATQKDQTLTAAADLADAIQASSPSDPLQPVVADNQLALMLQQLTIKLENMVDNLAQVKREVAEVRSNTHSSNSHNSNQHRSRSRSRSRSRGPRPQNLCWYHWKFGNAATKCTPPCSGAGNSAGGR